MNTKKKNIKTSIVKEIEAILEKHGLYLVTKDNGLFQLLTEKECKEKGLL